MKFLQNDINKFKECQKNEGTKKDSFVEKKGQVSNRGKWNQMLVTETEGLAAIDKG